MSDTDSDAMRYAAYSSRLRQVLLASRRYVAYTSDYGEAFRPVANKNVVRAAYGVSWAYVIYDVGKHGVDSHRDGSTPATVGLEMTKRAVFQGLASMALPAFTIHSTVKVFKGVTHCMQRFQRWGPTVAGLAIIPALPYLFDHPVEKAVDWAFSGITSSTD